MPSADANLKALVAFAETAAEYCRFIDSLRFGRPERLYTTLEALLPQLHSRILPVRGEMPETKHPEHDALAMTHQQWQETADIVKEVVSSEVHDVSGWHKIVSAEESLAAIGEYDANRAEALWDDLADIYRDLRSGLALWRTGALDGRAEASWQWRWCYENHWGEHLFRAMLTVHEIRYQLFRD
jgi:hypothetical protein